MTAGQRGDLLQLLKTLADEQRLTMVGLLHNTERTPGELATLLQLSESTITHHVGKLHGAGLLHLRMAGTQRFYRLNERRMGTFKQYVREIESLPAVPEETVSDDTWIDPLPLDADDKKVLRETTFNGRLTRLPIKQKKLMAVLRWLVTKFQPGEYYTEKQVNAILTEAHEDYATLRRNLVEYGFMRRERGGGNYWLTPDDEPIERGI